MKPMNRRAFGAAVAGMVGVLKAGKVSAAPIITPNHCRVLEAAMIDATANTAEYGAELQKLSERAAVTARFHFTEEEFRKAVLPMLKDAIEKDTHGIATSITRKAKRDRDSQL